MKILGVDTSSEIGTIGLIDDEILVAEYALQANAAYLKRLLLAIDCVLKEAELTIYDIEGFGVGIGPGSWTGLRIGTSTMKSLAHSLKKPICGISTLDAIAYNVRFVETLVCPIIGGRKDEVYTAFYNNEGAIVKRITGYRAVGISDLLAEISNPTIFLGNAALKYKYLILSKLKGSAIFADKLASYPRGSSIAALALTRIRNSDFDDSLSLRPLYLRKPAAETGWDLESRQHP